MIHPSRTTDGCRHRLRPAATASQLIIVLLLCAGAQAQFPSWVYPAKLNTDAATDTLDDIMPSLVTDRHGTWIAAWCSHRVNDGFSIDVDIRFARSFDNGASWSPPVMLNTNAATDSGHDQWITLATDGFGTWVATWARTTIYIYPDFRIVTARSIDNGATWSAPVPITSGAAMDYVPSIATDTAGNWIIVWQSDVSATELDTTDIFVSRSADNGATWSAPIPLEPDSLAQTTDDSHPTVSMDRNGAWLIGWNGSSSTDYDVFVSRSTDNGETWSARVPLNANAATDTLDDLGVRFATDHNGIWLAAWAFESAETTNVRHTAVSRSVDAGVTWTPIAVLEDMSPHVLVTDDSGIWCIGWEDRGFWTRWSNTNGDSWSARSNAPLYGSAHAHDVQIAMDNSGNGVAVWYSANDLGGPPGIDGTDILYTRTWTDPDGDGLSNTQEFSLGTDPYDFDSDGDGVSDGVEVSLGTDPLDPFGFPVLPVSQMWLMLGVAGLSVAAAIAIRNGRRAIRQ